MKKESYQVKVHIVKVHVKYKTGERQYIALDIVKKLPALVLPKRYSSAWEVNFYPSTHKCLSISITHPSYPVNIVTEPDMKQKTAKAAMTGYYVM